MGEGQLEIRGLALLSRKNIVFMGHKEAEVEAGMKF